MEQNTFDNFFKPYSETVDQADKASAFWRLSDALIMEIIKKEIGAFSNKDSVIMDAGGGTGRWAIKMCEVMDASIIVFDRSKDMLAKAGDNMAASSKKDRITLIEGDMTDMRTIADESVDHIVSIYSPLSFIHKQQEAAMELYRILKRGGRLLIMSHGYHNAIFSKVNNYRADIQEIKRLESDQLVKWAEYVPELATHSKESIERLLTGVGFKSAKVYGVPVFVQPGPEDFDPTNTKVSSTSRYLESPEVFQGILDIEMKHNAEQTVCNRGMNIFALVEK